jgi:hypothetical protein
MSNIVIIGFTCEGSTDLRFLSTVIRRTFEEVAIECNSEILVYDDIQYFEKGSGSFVQSIMGIAKKAHDNGVMVLCVHADADDRDDKNTFRNKIEPLLTEINATQENNICSNIVAVVPVYMTESWILADKELLKQELETSKSDNQLGINSRPEVIANPKEVIKEAIRQAFIHLPRRRSHLTIDELYLPIGAKISLEKLSHLPSYVKFRSAVQEAFRMLGYLQ